MGSKSDSATVVGSVLGFGFETGSDSATKGCFQPATLQSNEGNFQHYARLLRSLYTANEEAPSGSAQILHRCNTRFILDLVLPLVRILLLVP